MNKEAFLMQHLHVTCEESTNYVRREYQLVLMQFLFKTRTIICTIMLPANLY